MIELNNDPNNEPSPYLQKEALSATLSNEDIRKLYENMIKDEALKNYDFPSDSRKITRKSGLRSDTPISMLILGMRLASAPIKKLTE